MINTEDNNQGLVREAVYIKEKSYFNINNSIIDGFSSCVLLENKIGSLPANLAKINIQGLQINRCNGIVVSENAAINPELSNWYNSDTFSLESTKFSNIELFLQPDVKKNPDFRTRNLSSVVSSK